MKGENAKRRLTVIDYFIILTVVALLLAAGLRIYNDSIPDDSDTLLANEEYILTYESKGMNESAARLLEKGQMFYMTGGETEFGVLEDEPTIKPSRIKVELSNGELKNDIYAVANGNNSVADVSGSFRV